MADILILAVLAAVVGLIVRGMIRDKRRESLPAAAIAGTAGCASSKYRCKSAGNTKKQIVTNVKNTKDQGEKPGLLYAELNYST